LFAGLVIAALTLTGCTTTMIGSGEPPTGRWTLPAAQQHYLADVMQGNQDIAIVNRLVCTCVGELDPQQLSNACAAVANDELTLADNLETGAWPENATSAINALVAATKIEAKGYQSCASATSIAGMRSYEENITSSAAQVVEVRRTLGLPAVGPATMAPRSVVSSPPAAY
jgi:hypothetical protein